MKLPLRMLSVPSLVRAAPTPPTSPALVMGQPHGFTPLVARYDGPGIVNAPPGVFIYSPLDCARWSDRARPHLIQRQLGAVLDEMVTEAAFMRTRGIPQPARQLHQVVR